MANVLQELLNVCRFCLSENIQQMQPIMKVLDSTLTPDEIERYTGIRINTDEDCTLYAICVECTSKLQKSIEYRTACTNNQIHYEELLMMLLASTECADREDTTGSVICLDSDDETMDSSNFEEIFHEEIFSIEKNTPQEENIRQEENFLLDEDSYADTIRSSNSTQSWNRTYNEDDDMYSANYIEPGEPCTDSDIGERSDPTKKQRKKYTYKKDLPPEEKPIGQKPARKKKMYDFSALSNSNRYYTKSYKEGKRIYLKSLCDVCGNLVCDIHGHMKKHFPTTCYTCPHCPVKMTDKTNMNAHINTVHFKRVTKTCNICGKGFIHHKTYRYHMLGHHSQGKVFECKVCGKTFDKPFGLSDHCKRVHSLAKALKRTS